MKRFSAMFVIIAGSLWGSMGLFVRTLNDAGMTSFQIVGIRAVVTALGMFAYLLCFKRPFLKIKLRDVWCFFGTGILSILFFNFCYFTTILNSDLSIAAVLLYTAPSIVVILSVLLFNEKFTITKLAALVLSFAGCVCVSGVLGGGAVLTPVAVLTGLGSGLGYALYTIFSRLALDRGYDPLTITFYTFLIAAIGSLPFSYPASVFNTLCAYPSLILWATGLGLVNTVLPYLLYTVALKHMESGKAAIISSVEPVVATIIGIGVFGEAVTIPAMLGVGLVVLSIIVLNIGKKKSVD